MSMVAHPMGVERCNTLLNAPSMLVFLSSLITAALGV